MPQDRREGRASTSPYCPLGERHSTTVTVRMHGSRPSVWLRRPPACYGSCSRPSGDYNDPADRRGDSPATPAESGPPDLGAAGPSWRDAATDVSESGPRATTRGQRSTRDSFVLPGKHLVSTDPPPMSFDVGIATIGGRICCAVRDRGSCPRGCSAAACGRSNPPPRFFVVRRQAFAPRSVTLASCATRSGAAPPTSTAH